jgi:hypothetical protein
MSILKFIGKILTGLLLIAILSLSSLVAFVTLAAPGYLLVVKAFALGLFLFIAYMIGDILWSYWKLEYQRLTGE